MAESTKRRRKRQRRGMPDLPEDVITDILTCLPVKSLLRFRCVSKQFLTLIDGPDFIKRHLDHSFTKTNHKLILQQKRIIYSVDLYKLNKTLELDHPFKSNKSDIEIIGSVNGLLCLCNGDHDGKEDIVIWNLATRKYKKVPASNIEFPDYDCYTTWVNYGFGYDSESDSYKLLRLVRFYGKDNYYNTEAKVYSLRSNSWLRIQDCPYSFPYKRGCIELASGALHWGVTHNHGSGTTTSITAFDLATNEYKLLDYPEFLSNDPFHVTKLEGRLSVVCYKFFGGVDVWVMKEYGVKESWSKLFSVSKYDVFPKFGRMYPLAYSKSGNEIMLYQDSKTLLWYILKEGGARMTRLCARPDDFKPEICVESLVPLSGMAKDYPKKTGGKDAAEQINGAKKRDHGLISGVRVEAPGKARDK